MFETRTGILVTSKWHRRDWRSEVYKKSKWGEQKLGMKRSEVGALPKSNPSGIEPCWVGPYASFESVLTRVIHKSLAKPKKHGNDTSKKLKNNWKGNFWGQSNVAWWWDITRRSTTHGMDASQQVPLEGLIGCLIDTHIMVRKSIQIQNNWLSKLYAAKHRIFKALPPMGREWVEHRIVQAPTINPHTHAGNPRAHRDFNGKISYNYECCRP